MRDGNPFSADPTGRANVVVSLPMRDGNGTLLVLEVDGNVGLLAYL